MLKKTQKLKLIDKIKYLKKLNIYLEHDPKLISGSMGKKSNGYQHITFGQTNIEDLTKMCDRLIDERKKELDYDPTTINNILKEAYKK